MTKELTVKWPTVKRRENLPWNNERTKESTSKQPWSKKDPKRPTVKWRMTHREMAKNPSLNDETTTIKRQNNHREATKDPP